MQHPELTAILWSVSIVAVCAPLAVHIFRKRTTE
jgi:ABC-2 type transport system permease protein